MTSWLKQYPLVIGSLLFSIILWAWVHLGDEFETDLHVPLHIVAPLHKAIGSAVPETIVVSVRSTGWKIIPLAVNFSAVCTLDFSSMGREHVVVTEKTLLQNISLPDGIKAIDVVPDTILVSFDEVIERTLPVHEEVSIYCRDGFGVVGRVKTEPDSVRVRGARSIVERMTSATTEAVVLRDVRGPVNTSVRFDDNLGNVLSYSAALVNVHADVQAMAEVRLDNIPVEIRSVPASKYVSLVPPVLSVTLRGGVQQLASLSANDVLASIDYRTIALDTTGMITPTVTVPEEVKLLSRDPEHFRFVVRKAF